MSKHHRINFDELKAKADFAGVLLHYRINTFGSGEQLKIHCPFHDDERPSCSVNLSKGLWHCFRGCGAGNVLEFVHRMESKDGATVSLVQAAERLAEISGLELKNGSVSWRLSELRRKPKGTGQGVGTGSAERGAEKPSERPQTAPEKPARNKPLGFALTLDPTHPYLAERGISPELVELFGLGFCEKGSMAGRVCIPIHNAAGELVAYAGRFVGSETNLPEGEEKYKLPKALHKALELWNLHRVKRCRHLIIVEGFFAAMRLHSLRLPAVALMGSSISEEQLALLREYCPALRHVALMLDGDQAGEKAGNIVAVRLAKHWWTRIVLLPDGTQPDTVETSVLEQLLGRA